MNSGTPECIWLIVLHFFGTFIHKLFGMQHDRFVTLNNHHHNSRDLATRRKNRAIHASLQHMPNKIGTTGTTVEGASMSTLLQRSE